MATRLKAQEVIVPGESGCIDDLIARFENQARTENGAMLRAQHAKMHGLVKAEFVVEENLSPDLRVGIFKEPRVFPAWIRFSNSLIRLQTDTKGDVRGMAIKLWGVPGE